MNQLISVMAAITLLLALSWAPVGVANADRVAQDSRAVRTSGSVLLGPAMSSPRASHTATVLPDGRVLVLGGFVENGSSRGAEAYDPGNRRFAPLPPMVTTRHSHTATLLEGGKVLIVGGYAEEGRVLASAEVFDPLTNSFVSTGPLGSARAGHVAVRLDNGMVLVVGGVGPSWKFLASAELYNPATGRFAPAGTMSVARESHVLTRLRDGRVLIIGGHVGRRSDITIHSSAEVYDPANGTFSRVGDMRVRRHKHDAVLLPDGTVLVSGGADERDDRGTYRSTELFDPNTATFSTGPLMNLARYKHAGSSVVLPSGLVLVAGGAPQAEIYSPRNRTFTLLAGDHQMAGQFSAVAPLAAGGALITGGYGNGSGPRSSTWLYRP